MTPPRPIKAARRTHRGEPFGHKVAVCDAAISVFNLPELGWPIPTAEAFRGVACGVGCARLFSLSTTTMFRQVLLRLQPRCDLTAINPTPDLPVDKRPFERYH